MKGNTVIKKIDYLKSYGFSNDAINNMLNNHTLLNRYDVYDFKSMFNFLKSCGFTKEETISIVARYPEILVVDKEKLKEAFKVFKSIGVLKAVVNRPKIIYADLELVYARYRYLSLIGIEFNEENYGNLFIANTSFESVYKVTKEELLDMYNKNEYILTDSFLDKLDSPSTKGKMIRRDLLKLYCDTKDKKFKEQLREKLILKYMPACKEVVEKYANDNNKEDFLQIAYEELIKAIDSYLPGNNDNIYVLIYNNVSKRLLEEMSKDEELVSLTGNDIYSNISLEDSVVDKYYQAYLVKRMKDFFNENSDRKYLEVFKKMNGIFCEKEKVAQICEEYNICRQFAYDCNLKGFVNLYMFMLKEVNYMPSDQVKKYFVSSAKLLRIYTGGTLSKIYSLDLDKMEELYFYSESDSIEDSHRMLLERK